MMRYDAMFPHAVLIFPAKNRRVFVLGPGRCRPKVWLSQFKTQHRSIADDLGQLHETSINTNCLVILIILKYIILVNGKDDIPYIMENKIPWFQTTNQPKNSPNYIPFALPQRPYLGPSKENNASWTPKKNQADVQAQARPLISGWKLRWTPGTAKQRQWGKKSEIMIKKSLEKFREVLKITKISG